MACQFYFVGPDGIVRKNDEIMPVDVLAAQYEPGSLIFRFCFDPVNSKLHIQDECFRDRLAQGDELAWSFLNQALEAMEDVHDSRFLDRAFGDPVDSGIVRSLSQYPKAWNLLSEFLQGEFKVKPVDIQVYEYVPTPERDAERVSYLPPGAKMGDKPVTEPSLAVNRMIHKTIKECGSKDVDYELVGNALVCYYLDNLPELMKAIKSPEAQAVLKALDAVPEQNPFFALRMEGKTRIFRARKENGKFPDETAIRAKLPSYQGPVVFFRYETSQREIVLGNVLPSFMYADPEGKEMANDLIKSVSLLSGQPEFSVSISFDPGFGLPYLTNLQRYVPLWQLLKEDADPTDLPVLEAHGLAEGAKLVQGEKDESPDVKTFRAVRGLAMDYPYVLVDGSMPRGKKLRAVMDAIKNDTLDAIPGGSEIKNDSLTFDYWIKDEANRSKIRHRMACMLSMGLNLSEVLDLHAGPDELLKRAEFRKVLDEAVARLIQKKTVTASIPIGINDWWHMSTQEGFNQPKPIEKKTLKRTPKPFNLRKKKKEPTPEPLPVEGLLEKKRDPSQALKPAETLLRHSRI